MDSISNTQLIGWSFVVGLIVVSILIVVGSAISDRRNRKDK